MSISSLVNLSADPVMRGHVVIDAIDHIGEVWEAEFIALLTTDSIAILSLEDVVMALREGR
mgnify:CR=1 FL=1